LYEIKISIVVDGIRLDEIVKRIGFRKVELVEDRLEGTRNFEFYFKINNVPIFSKGFSLRVKLRSQFYPC
jgi:beta-galactosidase/beta-glucuronidase